MNINYPKTLNTCDELKSKLEELSVLLRTNVNQELFNKYDIKSKDLTNWIEEIEFEITNFC